MLTLPIMGALALAILWINTLLVVGAAWQERSALRSLYRRFVPIRVADAPTGAAGVLAARVAEGGAIATHEIEQVGRLSDSRPAQILWHDRAYRSEITGGPIESDGEVVRVAPAPTGHVWPDPRRLSEQSVQTTVTAFDERAADAKKARGTVRLVSTSIEGDQPVWVYGRFTRGPEGATLEPDDGELWVCEIDPRAWCRSKVSLVTLFIAAALLLAAACTAVALVPPAFGTVSKVGGALCLAYFLLVQPAGVSLREAVRTPDRAIVRGVWARRISGEVPASL
jgi:hypothetical protein